MSPEDLVTHYRITGDRMSPKRTTIDTGSATFVIGSDVNPVEYFLAAILGCVNSTGTMVAREMDLDLDALEMTVEGEVNYEKYAVGESDDRPGLQSITIKLDVTSSADHDSVKQWLAAVEERCPVTDNVENETPLQLSLQ